MLTFPKMVSRGLEIFIYHLIEDSFTEKGIDYLNKIFVLSLQGNQGPSGSSGPPGSPGDKVMMIHTFD